MSAENTRNTENRIKTEMLERYEEDLLGIPVVLRNAVIRETDAETGETTYTIPDMRGLVAAVAMARCLLPVKLSGRDIKFLRKALEMTQREFAEMMEVQPETVSRWESNGQTMAGYSEKLLRHHICAMLHDQAPAIDFDPARIAHMKIKPIGEDDEIPPLAFERVRYKNAETRHKDDTWDSLTERAA